MAVPALENGLQLVVHLRERGGTRLERLVFDQPETREQRAGFAVVGTGVVRAVILLRVSHVHEYSSLGTVSA